MTIPAGGRVDRRQYHNVKRNGSQRRATRAHYPVAQCIVVLVALCLSLFWTQASAARSPLVYARNYDHIQDQHLADVVALTDPAPSLDHHNPQSFVSKILIPRVPGTPGIIKARQLLLDVFQKQLGPNKAQGRSGWHVEEHAIEDDTPHGKKPFVNLIFTKNPKAPRKLVISAHYDSKWFSSGDFLGATDSASPCAMMIDLAIALDPLLEQKMGLDEDTTLQLLFFDGEEAFNMWTHTDSTYGSRALAANWSQTWHEPRRLTNHAPMRRIDGIDHLVLLDLLGAKDPVIPSYFSSTHWLFNELVSAESRLDKADLLYPKEKRTEGTSDDRQKRKPNSFFKQDSDPTGGGGIEDDHLPFLANGVPVLHVIPIPFPRVWHTLKDDASALDYPTQYAWAMILRLFTLEYLKLKLPSVKASRSVTEVGEAQSSSAEAEDGWGDDTWLRDSHQPWVRTELVGVNG